MLEVERLSLFSIHGLPLTCVSKAALSRGGCEQAQASQQIGLLSEDKLSPCDWWCSILQ